MPFQETQQSILDKFEPHNLSHKSWKSLAEIVEFHLPEGAEDVS
jgi:hypothetical protein